MGMTRRPPLGRAAPGGRFFPARMPAGGNVLVQTLPLRRAAPGPDRAARDTFERSLSLETLEAAAAGDPILAHRALGTADNRTLVWLLPLVELSKPKVRHAGDLIGLGIGLAAQLEARHLRGRTTPLLSEHSVTASGRIAGAQVFAAGPWLSDEVPPIRVAPEEVAAGRALPSGDVWRLGHMLSELARHFALPPAVSQLVEPDPRARPTAAEAVRNLEAQGAWDPPSRSTPAPRLEPGDTLTDEPECLDFDEPLPVPGRRWIAPLSLAVAGLFAGAVLSTFS